MTVSITELMRCVRHYFVSGAVDGAWRIQGGVLTGDAPLPAGWIAIDGLGAFPLAADGSLDAPDRAWDGRVWLLDPPADFLRLHEEINAWLARQDDPGDPAPAEPVVTRRSERFGAYATETEYALASASAAKTVQGDWEAAFAGRLAPYRRMFPEVSA